MSIVEIIFLSGNALVSVGATIYLAVNLLKMRGFEKAIVQIVSAAEYNSAKQKFPTHVGKRMQYLADEGKIKDSHEANALVLIAKKNAIALRFSVVSGLIVLIWKCLGRLED